MHLVDVALNKPAWQSSLSPWSTPAGASGCLQSEINQSFGFHTNLERHPWWMVDLLCSYKIERIDIYNRIDTAFDRCKTLKVEISDDGFRWAVIHDETSLFGSDDERRPLVIPVGDSQTARFVRLSLSEETYFHLFRVQIFSSDESVKASEQAVSEEIIGFQLRENNRKLKLSVIGTSNSIIGDYLSSIVKSDMEVIKNVSLGSSHATLLPYRYNKLNENFGNILIVDFYPNEIHSFGLGFDLSTIILDVLKDLSCQSFESDFVPIVLILPYRRYYRDPRYQKFHQMFEDMLYVNGILFFNGYDVVDDMARRWNRSTDSFFTDDAHLNKFAARCLGRALGLAIKSLDSRFLSPKFSMISEKIFAPKFEVFEASDYVDEDRVIVRSTSIASSNLVRLNVGDQIHFPVPSGSEVVGIVLNMARTKGALLIEGQNVLVKRLDGSHYNEGATLWLVVWSLQTPVAANSDRVTITCVVPDGSVREELNDHQEAGCLFDAKSAPLIEVGALVVRHPQAHRFAMRASGVELRLSQGFNF